jgi:hypothetical protein
MGFSVPLIGFSTSVVNREHVSSIVEFTRVENKGFQLVTQAETAAKGRKD